MAFMGGERSFSVPAAVLAAVIGAGVVAVANESGGVSLETLASTHALHATRNPTTGVVTLRGEVGVVKLAPGLSIASVNGTPVQLEQPAWVRSGRIYVGGAFAGQLDRMLARPVAAPLASTAPGNPAPLAQEPVTTVASDHTPMPEIVDDTPLGWRVVIDAGHGGKYDGTIGPTGLREKDLTLPLAGRLGARLASLGIEVVQTRQSDLCLSDNWSEDLDLRVAVADRADADLFLSLHFNSEPSGSVQGFELHLPRTDGGGPADGRLSLEALAGVRDRGLQAANSLRAALRDTLDTPDRGLKFGRKRVVYRSPIPAILVEYAFISHPDSEARYRDAAALDALADATARGVRDYLRAFAASDSAQGR